MKRFYSKFRIGLMTFALGLASVFISDGSLYSDKIYVDLPKTNSGEIIIIFPRYGELPSTGAGGSGQRRIIIESKSLKNKNKIKL